MSSPAGGSIQGNWQLLVLSVGIVGLPRLESKGRNGIISRFKGGKIEKVAAPRPHTTKAAEQCRSPEPIAHIAYEQLAMCNLHFLLWLAIPLHALFGCIRVVSRIVYRSCPRILFNSVNPARALRSPRSDTRLTRPPATPICWVFLHGIVSLYESTGLSMGAGA